MVSFPYSSCTIAYGHPLGVIEPLRPMRQKNEMKHLFDPFSILVINYHLR